jgi:hypothetical protein
MLKPIGGIGVTREHTMFYLRIAVGITMELALTLFHRMLIGIVSGRFAIDRFRITTCAHGQLFIVQSFIVPFITDRLFCYPLRIFLVIQVLNGWVNTILSGHHLTFP